MWVYGLPGFIADTETWAKWLSKIRIEQDGWNFVFVALGAIMFIYAAYPALERFFSTLFRSKTKTTRYDNAPLPENVSTQPTNKIYTQRTVAEIFSTVRKMTSIRAEDYARIHIAKWIRVQNKISNISEYGDFIVVYLAKDLGPMVILKFKKSEWESTLETMDKGDTLAAEGKIEEIESIRMHLVNCSIVEKGETDDAFSISDLADDC